VTDTGDHFTARDGNLFDEACDHIRTWIVDFARLKAITLSSDDIDICAEHVADQLADAALYGVACDKLDARDLARRFTRDHLRDFYVHKLSLLAGDLGQRPFFAEIAISHHLKMAELQPPHTWPSAAAYDAADFASGDIGPVVWNFTDGVVSTTYHRGVRLHRNEEDGPALAAVSADGKMIEQEYWRDGHLHRDNGPAKILSVAAINIVQETWMQHGRMSRLNAPAYIERTASGRVITAMWFTDGVFCRADGPAGLWRASEGADTWTMQQFSLDGVTVRAFENGIEIPYV
jgi:hypothetical protein